jgi:cytochrome c
MRNLPLVVLLAACGASQSADTSPAPAAEPAAAAPAAEPAAPATSNEAAEAAERGAALYGEKCATCHGDAGQGAAKAPPVVGKDALPLEPRSGSKRGVQFKTALDVARYVKAKMPADDPGSLSDEDARAIVAFDLKANGVDLAGKDLSDATLAAIALH